jgi:hypothetical protein
MGRAMPAEPKRNPGKIGAPEGSPVVSGMGSWWRVRRVGPKRAAVRPVACRSWM